MFQVSMTGVIFNYNKNLKLFGRKLKIGKHFLIGQCSTSFIIIVSQSYRKSCIQI